MKCHDSLCPPQKVKPPAPFLFIYFGGHVGGMWGACAPFLPPPPHLATPAGLLLLFFLQFWDRMNLPSILDFFEVNWFFMKTMICTCQLHISHQNWTFAHFDGVMFAQLAVDEFFTDLHIWGRCVCINVVICTFEGEMFAQMWLFAHLRVKCLHILWDVCTFHVKIEPLHIWRRHVCTLVVDGVLLICTFDGAVFAQMWLFAHFEGKMFAQMCLFAHLWYFQISRLHTPPSSCFQDSRSITHWTRSDLGKTTPVSAIHLHLSACDMSNCLFVTIKTVF